MNEESAKQVKKYIDARDALRDAKEHYEQVKANILGALKLAEDSMADMYDEDALRQIEVMRGLVRSLPVVAFDGLETIAETLEALANEVTAEEEHVPAGVS